MNRIVCNGRLADLTRCVDADLSVPEMFTVLHRIPRWGGHAEDWSVLQHCMLGASVAPTPELALAFLWHEAGEVFFGDMTTELKRHPEMRWFRELEHAQSAALARHYAPTAAHSDPAVKWLDWKCLMVERDALFPVQHHDAHWPTEPEHGRLGVQIQTQSLRYVQRMLNPIGMAVTWHSLWTAQERCAVCGEVPENYWFGGVAIVCGGCVTRANGEFAAAQRASLKQPPKGLGQRSESPEGGDNGGKAS